MWRTRLLALLAFTIYSALRFTWRIRFIEPPEFQTALRSKGTLVLAHWHGDELGILHSLKRYHAAAMISTSKDGEIMNAVVELLGAKTSRGSSTRGGAAALRGIIRLSKDGWRPSVAVDGPKGPYHKVKPGVFEISRLIKGDIYPLTVAADRKFVFEKAWNKTFLPLPFARVVVGPALPAIDKNTDSRDPELARRLEEALANAGQQASNSIATPHT
jgi:lysophospholipid acyltransferase (LPLAT)-like uncharacterized protein